MALEREELHAIWAYPIGCLGLLLRDSSFIAGGVAVHLSTNMRACRSLTTPKYPRQQHTRAVFKHSYQGDWGRRLLSQLAASQPLHVPRQQYIRMVFDHSHLGVLEVFDVARHA